MCEYRREQALVFRACIALMTSTLAIATTSHSATAEWKLEQNVEIVIPTSAGTGSDATGRFIQRLFREKRLISSTASVVNKPGGAAAVAVNYLNQHAGNGHYFMITTPAQLTSYITGATRINYTDTTPLAQIGKESVAFGVRADSPIKSAEDLLRRLKADPGSISFAISNAAGNQNHIAVAQVVKSIGMDTRKLKTVIFNGSRDAMAALLGAHVDVQPTVPSALWPQVAAGKVRIIAVSADQRLGGALSAIPIWKELGVASVSALWRALVGPKGMSDGQIRYWDGVFAKLVQLPEWKQDMEAHQRENIYLDAAHTRKMMDAEYAELARVLTDLGMAK